MDIDEREWIETDGLGGFASGTISGVRTRRYHALLCAATRPPTGRMVLVNGVEAWVETGAGRFALSTSRYEPGVLHPDGAARIESFEHEPWPRWTFRLPDGTTLLHEVIAEHGSPVVALAWRVVAAPRGGPIALTVRPLLSGRDYHALHRENPAFRFDPGVEGQRVRFHPYPGVPAMTLLASGSFRAAPEWYRQLLYTAERERGLDCIEDLASPGELRFDLARGEAAMILAAEIDEVAPLGAGDSALARLERIRNGERRRRSAFPTPLHRAADAYIARRGSGRSIVAGYPWFTDWGRDTFIAMRGLCLATGRLDVARDILVEWAGAVSEGMLPNRFPDRGEEPEYNAVDASLWYVVAAGEYLRAAEGLPGRNGGAARDQRVLVGAIEAILDGHVAGTRYRIRMDGDGLLACGVPGVQLTWMDARVGDRVVTPRIGKPVEVQALWVNALLAGAERSRTRGFHFRGLAARALASFRDRFWDEELGYLRDVVDVDHDPARVDRSLRPNQILAIGGLPVPLLDGDRARRTVDAVAAKLLTPLGLRTLSPDDPAYLGRYRGSPAERDGAYHNGTVWPWLLGPFIEAFVRVRGDTADVRRLARERFLVPLLAHLDDAGLGHVSECADGDPPHRPGGCPFQAWSLGELLRASSLLAAAEPLAGAL